MKKWLYQPLVFLLLWGGLTLPVSAQETITIEQCQAWAMENYPMLRQHGLIDKGKEYMFSNLSRKYLPEFSLTGNASWQSEKTELDLKLPDKIEIGVDPGSILPGTTIPEMKVPVSIPSMTVPISGHDRYGVGLSLQQVLWAGGRIKAGKGMVKAETDMMHEGLDAQLYAIKDKIAQLYFGILTIDGRLEQLDRADEILAGIQTRAEVALKEGMIYPTDLDVVDVERMKYKQLRAEAETKRVACVEVLSRFIHRPLSPSTLLQEPEGVAVPRGDEIKRPELKYLKAKKDRLEADQKMITAENMPKIGLFGIGGYGKSGLNTFKDENSSYFVGGVHVGWNFGKLYTLKNDRKLVRVKQESVDIEAESFIFNTRMELILKDGEVARLVKMIQGDSAVVAARERIRKASEVKYANGVYTISELIMDVNQALIARQEMLLRELELKAMIYSREVVAGGGKN